MNGDLCPQARDLGPSRTAPVVLTALSVEVWIDGFEPLDRRPQCSTGLVDIQSIVAALDSRHDVSRDRCENLGGDWQTHWLDRTTDILHYSSQAPLSLGQRAQTVDVAGSSRSLRHPISGISHG